MCYNLSESIDQAKLAMEVISGLYHKVKTTEIDDLTASLAASKTMNHPDYSKLAARITATNLHKQTSEHFSHVIERLYRYVDLDTNRVLPMISDKHYNIIMKNSTLLDATICSDRDFELDYLGIKTLQRSYLLKINGEIVERPQFLYMRVAIGIHGDDVKSAIETYHGISRGYYIHATPTLFSAATPNAQMSSCFLLTLKEDSITGIYETLAQTAAISKAAGGIGLSIHNLRATGSYIAGTNGTSSGIVPMLRVFNNTARYVDQGGNKRPGSFAIYLEPWHADIIDFLELKLNTGNEEMRARDLFYGLWIPDLFMKRVEKEEMWSLMCPNACPGLSDVYGENFEKLYCSYEAAGKYVKQISAIEIWYAILKSQIETGTPYMLYKDACNFKSNQNNLGTIHSSNLCTEIIQYTSPNEIAVCNLASIALPKFIKHCEGHSTFDFTALKFFVRQMTINLNKIIDINQYPLEEAKNSNLRHRPIGIGVQGLADCFMILRLPYESTEAIDLNSKIFETIYYSALETSCDLARQYGRTYETYQGSPMSKGKLQFDLWKNKVPTQPQSICDWAKLRKSIKEYGVYNSLLTAPMPTASTASILGNYESFEPCNSNFYTRRVLSGQFQMVNKYLIKDLINLKLWTDDMKNTIMAYRGSIQKIESIPIECRNLYKTVWEIPLKTQIKMAADRGAFIDQSQSFNIHMEDPNLNKLTSMHFTGWRSGLKTGMYYLRTKPVANPIQFTVDSDKFQKYVSAGILNNETCHLDECLSCSS